MSNRAGTEYQATFNLASAAGQLITTIDKMTPARATVKWSDQNANFFRPAVSPNRQLNAVTVSFSVAATQTFTVSIVDAAGTARAIGTLALVAATSAFFEPEHPIIISGAENIQVDVTATGAPAVTGTICAFMAEV